MAQTSNIARPQTFLSNVAYDTFPVTASVHLYQGQLIGVQDATQTVLAATNATTIRFAGVAQSESDNSDNVSGILKINVYTSGEFVLPTEGAVTYGAPLYIVDDQTVGISGSTTSNAVYVGRALKEYSTDKWIVALDGKHIRGFQTT